MAIRPETRQSSQRANNVDGNICSTTLFVPDNSPLPPPPPLFSHYTELDNALEWPVFSRSSSSPADAVFQPRQAADSPASKPAIPISAMTKKMKKRKKRKLNGHGTAGQRNATAERVLLHPLTLI